MTKTQFEIGLTAWIKETPNNGDIVQCSLLAFLIKGDFYSKLAVSVLGETEQF